MSEKNDQKPIDRREAERGRLQALKARQWLHDDSTPPGVLLSDVIQHYCERFGLISPFNERNLKPACYKLTIGDEYAIAGKIHPLSDRPGKNELRIPAFAVAIIKKTRETINMPRFLIGRWNIQVSRAYQGLVWARRTTSGRWLYRSSLLPRLQPVGPRSRPLQRRCNRGDRL